MNNKLPLQTPNLTSQNIDKIAALFPNCITEMLDEEKSTPDHKVYKRGINFELLKQMLSPDVVDGDEAYEFTWVGKKASIVEANKPIRKTLRPCPAESKNWDDTENLYIEGDNLEVLKLLRTSYLHKVKMIYIDPPYNTGNDFIYADNFMRSQNEENRQMGMYDEEDNRLFKNNDTNGKFHSDWCSMMYSRLLMARDFLTNDGAIFISIDDSEVRNLKNMCDEIFGNSNFVAQLIWQNKKGGGNDSKHIAIEHEYILVYASNKELLAEFYERYSDEYIKRYKEEDSIGRFYWDTFKRKAGKQYYPITCPDGTTLEYDDDGNPISWLRSKARFEADLKIGDVRFVNANGKWSVQFKQRIPEGKTPRSIFTTAPVVSTKGTTSTGASDVYEYFKKDVFSNPKPVKLIEFLLSFCLGKDDIVLDFFSGSGTTADAVMNANLFSGNNNKFILVQLAEDIDKMLSSSSANAKRVADNAISVLDEIHKPHFITELSKERIRRAGQKVDEENNCWKCVPLNRMDGSKPGDDTTAKIVKTIDAGDGKPPIEMVDISKNPDVGFRVFKLDDTNMKDVYYSAEEYSQTNLEDLESNIKEDRTDLDLLFGCLLDWGLPLSMPYRSEKIGNCTVHTYAPGDAALNVPDALIACFDSNVPENVIKEIAKRKPRRAVFRDSSFASSPEKINVFEIFKLYAPDTDVKVI